MWYLRRHSRVWFYKHNFIAIQRVLKEQDIQKNNDEKVCQRQAQQVIKKIDAVLNTFFQFYMMSSVFDVCLIKQIYHVIVSEGKKLDWQSVYNELQSYKKKNPLKCVKFGNVFISCGTNQTNKPKESTVLTRIWIWWLF